MIRLVLFDIDGTLIRTGGAGMHAFGRAFASVFNIPHGTERMKFAGRTDSSLVREFLEMNHLDPSPENFELFFDCYVHGLDHLLDKFEGGVCAGVREFICDLSAHPSAPAIGLLTGNIRLGAELKLRHYDLWGAFATGGFGDDHEDRAEIARVAVERGGRLLGTPLKGSEVLVIGDTPRDVACAQAIGARSLAVATGGATLGQLEACNPTWAAASLLAVSPAEVCA